MTRVLVVFGGRSGEHSISCLSAANVDVALRAAGHETVLVGITPAGRWTLQEEVPPASSEQPLPRVPEDRPTALLTRTVHGPRLLQVDDAEPPVGVEADLGPIDVAFPVLHGPYGEDGTIQGLFASLGVPYVGADVAASGVGIDKRQMKAALTSHGLPQLPYQTVRQHDWETSPEEVLDQVEIALGYPVFTKPTRQGSSIGISRCEDRDGLAKGLIEALAHDREAIVEQGLEQVRELECGILGNADPQVTRPGELVHTGSYYDFDAKYLAPVELTCPADVPELIAERCQHFAREAFLGIGARGMARVDFFYLPEEDTVLVNEINTIPGMTDQSMFWWVWDAEGVDRPQLVDRLVGLALEAEDPEQHWAP